MIRQFAGLLASAMVVAFCVSCGMMDQNSSAELLDASLRSSKGESGQAAGDNNSIVKPLQTFTILASAGPGGTISPSGAVRVPQGYTRAFLLTPLTGYDISEVIVDGKSMGTVGAYVFSRVNANHTIVATFRPLPDTTALPLDLTGTVPEHKSAGLYFAEIPLNAVFVDLTLTIYDADYPEGYLEINGQRAVDLFGSQGIPANDSRSVTLAPIRTPISLYREGDNYLTFWHLATAGFRVEGIRYTFVSGTEMTPTATPTPTPTSAGECDFIVQSGDSLNRYSATAQAGQTVCVRAGTYHETLRPEISGSSGQLITFRADPPSDACQGAMGKPKIPGSCKVVIDGANTRATGVDLGSRNYIRIEGFEIKNHRGPGVSNYYDWYASGYQTQGNQIVKNYIHHNGGDGITSMNSEGAQIENNEIYYNGLTAVRFGGEFSSAHLVARGNNLHLNQKDGFQGGGDDLLLEYNEIYDQHQSTQHQDCFDIGWVTNSTFRYNTISDCTQLLYGGQDRDTSRPASEVKNWENLDIYGNVFYTHYYWTLGGSDGGHAEAPGIFIDQRFEPRALAKNIRIHSNTFGWLGYGSIWIQAASANQISDIQIYNNIFYDGGIDVIGDAHSAVSDYNLFRVASARPPYEGSHSVVGEPQFIRYQSPLDNPNFTGWDFRLSSTSPAIDSGHPNLGSLVPLPVLFEDLEGNMRPLRNQYDMGAYEVP